MSSEEEGSAKDDWEVLGFQNWMGGGAFVAAGERAAGPLAVRSWVRVSEAPQSPIVVSVSKPVQRVGKEYF